MAKNAKTKRNKIKKIFQEKPAEVIDEECNEEVNCCIPTG